jgi:hypothetical protein
MVQSLSIVSQILKDQNAGFRISQPLFGLRGVLLEQVRICYLPLETKKVRI